MTNVILIDCNGERHYKMLTDDQLALLNWLGNRDFFYQEVDYDFACEFETIRKENNV